MEIHWEKAGIKEVAGLVCSALRKAALETVVVGGACVTIYTKNAYVSGDIDIISSGSSSKIMKVLLELGFKFNEGRYFERKDCKFFVEFIAPPVAIGGTAVNRFNSISTRFGKLTLLTPGDCVKDRLAAYFYWNDRQSLGHAVLVAQKHKVSLIDIEKWALKENQKQKFNIFKEKIKKMNTSMKKVFKSKRSF